MVKLMEKGGRDGWRRRKKKGKRRDRGIYVEGATLGARRQQTPTLELGASNYRQHVLHYRRLPALRSIYTVLYLPIENGAITVDNGLFRSSMGIHRIHGNETRDTDQTHEWKWYTSLSEPGDAFQGYDATIILRSRSLASRPRAK
jgi:hypothetical protein